MTFDAQPSIADDDFFGGGFEGDSDHEEDEQGPESASTDGASSGPTPAEDAVCGLPGAMRDPIDLANAAAAAQMKGVRWHEPDSKRIFSKVRGQQRWSVSLAP